VKKDRIEVIIMKKYHKLIISAVISIIFSFNFAYAMPLPVFQEDKAQLLEQIKEKRQIIKNLQERDEQIGRKIEKKMEVLEHLLMKLPESGVLPQEHMQKQLEKEFEKFMEQLMRLSEYEVSMWKHLEKANKLIESGKYKEGLKTLDKVIEIIEEEHQKIIEFDELADEFIDLVKSFDLK